MKYVAISFMLLLLSAGANAQGCVAQVQVQPNSRITLTLCPGATGFSAGTQFTITEGGVPIPVEAEKVTTIPDVAVSVQTKPVDASKPEIVLLAQGGSQVTVNVGTTSITANVRSESLYTKYARYKWAIGPAETGDSTAASGTGSTGASTASNAIRLQFSSEYANGHPLGTKGVGWQTIGTLLVDTTDKHDPSFIDNNRATFGAQLMQLSVGNLLKQGRAGVELRASKAFHQDIHDIDGVATFAAWLPVIPALNFMNNSGNFIAPPLSFAASYGYRNRQESGTSSHGPVFEGTALYHMFALDRINLDVNGTWTVSNLSNRPATTPRTQRMYKATISYLQNPDTGFTLLTSVENGSFGVMLTKVRQYFVGMAISKINFSGNGSK